MPSEDGVIILLNIMYILYHTSDISVISFENSVISQVFSSVPFNQYLSSIYYVPSKRDTETDIDSKPASEDLTLVEEMSVRDTYSLHKCYDSTLHGYCRSMARVSKMGCYA